MKTAIICFTARGTKTATRIRDALKKREISVRVWCAKSGFVPQPEACGNSEYDLSTECDPGECVEPLQKPLYEWTGEAFAEYDALVFVGATGIAVRSVAPFLRSKTSDPAVLCVDELGKFVIPLVSGHIGGANELASGLANALGAVAVITTATDLNGRFAVDVFAKENRLWISDMKLAKQISAAVLDGKKIGFFSDFPLRGKIPEEIGLWNAGEENSQKKDTRKKDTRKKDTPKKDAQGDVPEKSARAEDASALGICVTTDETKRPFRQTLTLIPRIVSVGVGCRKDTDSSLIEEKILAALRSCGLSTHSVERLASIDLKAREPGLCAFAEKYELEFVTYTAQELKEAPGEFEESAFVEAVTGVSNVCERSAVLASGGGSSDRRSDEHTRADAPASRGRIIQKKTAGDGVTVALAVRDWSVEFG